jgi:predicted transcriptional regulator
MKAYRNRDELFASILRSAAKNKDGSRFTRLLYDSFLSYAQISHHLRELIRFGLLVNEPDITKYSITQKGMKFIELFEKMDYLLKSC